MEDKNCFDLNRAISEWKDELSLEPGISPQDIRELESHLVDSITAELRNGLEQREAFEAAVRNLGPIRLIGAEFEKAAPMRTWASRASLMVLSGLMIWIWTQVSSTLLAATNLISRPDRAFTITLAIFLNAVVPLALVFLVSNGGARKLLRGLAQLFSNRWLLFGTLFAFALFLDYARAWVLWHQPNPEQIFGPGGRANFSIGRLFWYNLTQFPYWPGPILALALWLQPHAYRALNAAGVAASRNEKLNRELMLWIATGWLALSCCGWLSGAFYMLWSAVTSSLFAYSELGFRVMLQVAQVLPALFLCTLGVLAARGRFAGLGESIFPRLASRGRLIAFGMLVIILCYGSRYASIQGLARWGMQPTAEILAALPEVFWPAVMAGIIAWLVPSVVEKSACREQPH